MLKKNFFFIKSLLIALRFSEKNWPRQKNHKKKREDTKGGGKRKREEEKIK